MKKSVLFFFFGLLYSIYPNLANAQDSKIRISGEIDFRLVPVLNSFSSDYRFLKINTEASESGFQIVQTNNNFRASYSARLNVDSKNRKFLFGFAARYSRSTNYSDRVYHPDSSFSLLMTENLVADYGGGNFRILFDPKNKNRKFNGFTIGGGVLLGRSNLIDLTYNEEEIISSGNSKKTQYLTEEIFEYELGYKVRLYDLYLNYTYQRIFNIGNRMSLFFGCEIPLVRLFFFNNQARFGLSFNDEDFFTISESYTLHLGDQMTANKNFAYSLKKTNSFSLNFGIRYAFN